MRSKFIPNSYIRETKPWTKNHGLYICVTEKWKEIANTLNHHEYNYLKKKLINITTKKKDRDYYIQQILLFVKRFGTTLQNINIQEQTKPPHNDAVHTDKSFIITIWENKFFVKIAFNSDDIYNGYNESIWLWYSKELLHDILQTINANSINIHIEILESLYAVYNKHNNCSLIITPYKEWYESLEKVWHNKSSMNINTRQKEKIITYITTLEKTLQQSIIGDIKDILDSRNILIKKNNKWHINLILTDPYIKDKHTDNIHSILIQHQ